MSRLNRKQLKRLLLKEFKMIGMTNPGIMGHSQHQGMGHAYDMGEDHLVADMGHSHMSSNTVSKEDCCKAVLCLIECCDCPKTKEIIRQCCEDILSSC